MDEISRYNRQAWDAVGGTIFEAWTKPVNSDEIQEAREGTIKIKLTPGKTVPSEWFPVLKNRKVLCLASGGGQQGPILAAAGARVTVIDNSPNQLKQDESVAKREGLEIKTILGDIRDLSILRGGSYGLIINMGYGHFENFIPVWNQIAELADENCVMLSGFTNPFQYIFDYKAWLEGKLVVRHTIPYSDVTDLTDEEKRELIYDRHEPMFCSGTMEEQIQGQISAGFAITGFYEDVGGGALDKFIQGSYATRAVKIRGAELK